MSILDGMIDTPEQLVKAVAIAAPLVQDFLRELNLSGKERR